ncbi:hypothetical protein [Flaviaesturariibacter amylovorans]|uniref:hypothetical protein n=1 Tax=Flaviaesturariibacter amylovorans TaxID=1084520 RepID=UPI0031E9FB7D
MEKNLSTLSLQQLQELYHEESRLLRNALLEGRSWEEVQEHRHHLIDIEAAMHRTKPQPEKTPPEPGREHRAPSRPDTAGST